jgi:hypothetical protein
MAGKTTPEELEGVALALYRQAGLDADAPTDPVDLAERLLGEGCVRLVHSGALPGTAALARVAGDWRIYVRSRASATRQRFAVLHELGHFALGASASEEACDAVAAALLLPRPAFRAAARELGADWPALAARFGCSESAAALRWGEVIGDPLALVAPLTVRVRGLPWGWPPHEHAIRELAAGPRPGLASTRLRDDRRRLVLRAAG